MKGITHFLTGIALATFFPEVIHAAEAGSLLPVLGGVGGLLPDTLDFKFVQFWEDYDVEIDPGPEPNADAIADAIVKALHTAYTSLRPVHLLTHTIRLGADAWRRYTLEFLPEAGEIAIRIGPVVTTGQKPFAGSESDPLQIARRKVAVPLSIPYAQSYEVDIFRGPSFMLAREGESVHVSFLDWHHRWTHSLLLALIAGLAVALGIGLLWGWTAALLGGVVCWLGFSAHVLEDQLGYLGCNLWWPVSKRRKPGAGLFHAGDSLPNFITVCLSLLLMMFNLDRYSAAPFIPHGLYLPVVIGGPLAALMIAVLWKRRRKIEAEVSDLP